MILAAGPAQAFHKGVVHGGGEMPGETIQTLNSLACAAGEIAKWTGTVWDCAVDEDTAPTTSDVEGLGFVTGGHTAAPTTSDVEGLGFVTGAHTVDTDTTLDQAGIEGFGFVTGAHTVDTDTTLNQAGIEAFGFVTGAHTVDTDTTDLQAQIDDLYFDLSTNTVFVTNLTFNGNLGGNQGADQICNSMAGAAGLNGNYKAWLSTSEIFSSGEDARDHLTHSGMPYVRTDGVQVADNWIDLTDGQLDAPITVDENGMIPNLANIYVWTGTNFIGDRTLPPFDAADPLSSDNCVSDQGFESSIGRAVAGILTATDQAWTDAVAFDCAAFLHLYCIEQ